MPQACMDSWWPYDPHTLIVTNSLSHSEVISFHTQAWWELLSCQRHYSVAWTQWWRKQPRHWARWSYLFSPLLLQLSTCPKGTTAWMRPRHATLMTLAKSTGLPTSPRAPAACPTRCATAASATKLSGSSSTRCQQSTATGCSSAHARILPVPSAGVRPSCPCVPMRRERNPTAWLSRIPARPITSAGKTPVLRGRPQVPTPFVAAFVVRCPFLIFLCGRTDAGLSMECSGLKCLDIEFSTPRQVHLIGAHFHLKTWKSFRGTWLETMNTEGS